MWCPNTLPPPLLIQYNPPYALIQYIAILTIPKMLQNATLLFSKMLHSKYYILQKPPLLLSDSCIASPHNLPKHKHYHFYCTNHYQSPNYSLYFVCIYISHLLIPHQPVAYPLVAIQVEVVAVMSFLEKSFWKRSHFSRWLFYF